MAKTKKVETAKTASAKKKSATQPTKEPSARAGAEVLDVSGAREVFLSAQKKLSKHAPSDALRARFEAQVSKGDAIAVGTRIASDVVLFDAMTDVPLVLNAVMASKVRGFGPREAHYTLSLALALDSAWRSFHDR